MLWTASRISSGRRCVGTTAVTEGAAPTAGAARRRSASGRWSASIIVRSLVPTLGQERPQHRAGGVARVGEVDDLHAELAHRALEPVALGRALPVVALEDRVERALLPDRDLVL